MITLEAIMGVYRGSDGASTKALYDRLHERCGPAGKIAVNLFRASKTSGLAKRYRGGDGHSSYKSKAYERKGYSLRLLDEALTHHGAELGITWGWGIDEKASFNRYVIYVDIPTGQVSFHSATRGNGPDYGKPWDGARGATAGRIMSWCAQLLKGES